MPSTGSDVRTRSIRFFTIAVAVAISATTLVRSAPPADAAPQQASHEDFYIPPSPLPATPPGTVLRSAPSVAAIIPGTPAVVDASTTRVMYSSTSPTGQPTAVTGTILVPSQPWTGAGPRPTVVLGPGTQGMGDQCAPSKLLPLGQEYETLHIGPLLAQGYTVAVTDYEGLGTPGLHPYLNRTSLGRSMLDMARAAADHTGNSASPVAFWGYSEGGMASASAAELHASYAPEVPVVGAVAGAPPASLSDLAVAGDGSLLSGGLGWVVQAFITAYPDRADEFEAAFNPAGREILQRVSTLCAYDMLRMNPCLPTSSYTVDGRPIIEHLTSGPWVKAVADQELGNTVPDVPVLVANSTSDDLVLPSGIAAMVDKWCAGGASVVHHPYNLPPLIPKTVINHGVGILPALPDGLDWLDRRFSRRPVESNC